MKNKYKESTLKIGLALNHIGMLVDDKTYKALVKEQLDIVESEVLKLLEGLEDE